VYDISPGVCVIGAVISIIALGASILVRSVPLNASEEHNSTKKNTVEVF
jgi:hypothetical protein